MRACVCVRVCVSAVVAVVVVAVAVVVVVAAVVVAKCSFNSFAPARNKLEVIFTSSCECILSTLRRRRE